MQESAQYPIITKAGSKFPVAYINNRCVRKIYKDSDISEMEEQATMSEKFSENVYDLRALLLKVRKKILIAYHDHKRGFFRNMDMDNVCRDQQAYCDEAKK